MQSVREMQPNLIGETWEAFYIERRKEGFLHRVTAYADEPQLLTTKLRIVYGSAYFQHTFSFYNRPNYPAHSFVFDTNDGAPIQARFENGTMICQVDDDQFVESVPVKSRPAYGNYPLIITMPFERDAQITYTQIDESSCVLVGQTQLISHGWEEVEWQHQRLKLWLVGEYTNGRLGNRYWLDAERRIRLTQWQGAVSNWVATKEEAVRGLSAEIQKRANQLDKHQSNVDWTQEIEAWLNNEQSSN